MDKPTEKLENGTLSRYDLSYVNYRKLLRAHILFEEAYTEEFKSRFLCRILLNYLNYLPEKTAERFLEQIHNQERNQNQEDYHSGRISLTKDLVFELKNFCSLSRERFRKRTVINYILEQFVNLPLAECERIYCYTDYHMIQSAIEQGYMLLLSTTGSELPDERFEVKPLDLRIDENSGSWYLIGYSRSVGRNEEWKCGTFKLSRIRKCQVWKQPCSLSAQERKTAITLCERFGAAYIPKKLKPEDVKVSRVRLTKDGYERLYLKVIGRQRPLPCKEPHAIMCNGELYYELEFDCSYYQILNYFFLFGKDAQVIEPEWLRAEITEKYRQALDAYQECENTYMSLQTTPNKEVYI